MSKEAEQTDIKIVIDEGAPLAPASPTGARKGNGSFENVTASTAEAISAMTQDLNSYTPTQQSNMGVQQQSQQSPVDPAVERARYKSPNCVGMGAIGGFWGGGIAYNAYLCASNCSPPPVCTPSTTPGVEWVFWGGVMEPTTFGAGTLAGMTACWAAGRVLECVINLCEEYQTRSEQETRLNQLPPTRFM